MKGVGLSGGNQCQMEPRHALVHPHPLLNNDCLILLSPHSLPPGWGKLTLKENTTPLYHLSTKDHTANFHLINIRVQSVMFISKGINEACFSFVWKILLMDAIQKLYSPTQQEYCVNRDLNYWHSNEHCSDFTACYCIL